MADDHTGPRRVLALLWGRDAHPRRGPKPTLTVERIVEVATGVADAEGLNALSMRRVAEELGVGTASLYTYVAGKDELLALMLDVLIGQERPVHTLPGDWRAKVTAWASRDWRSYVAHPWGLRLAATPQVLGPGVLGWFDSALGVLEGTGLSEAEKQSAITAIDAYVRGQADDALRRAATDDVRDDQGRTWGQIQEAFLAEHVDWRDYPYLSRLSGTPSPNAEAEFDFGLQCLLDGIEARMGRADRQERPEEHAPGPPP
jgi:AcrR family transcriptional regulator